MEGSYHRHFHQLSAVGYNHGGIGMDSLTEIIFWIWLGSISIADFILAVLVIKMAQILLWGGDKNERIAY